MRGARSLSSLGSIIIFDLINLIMSDRYNLYKDFICKGLKFLLENFHCKEDNLSHNGRLAYCFTLANWIKENKYGNDKYLKNKLDYLSKQVFSNIKCNSLNSWFVYPGNEVARNHTTNAIDCGIFVDASFDLFKISSQYEEKYKYLVDKVALTYSLQKINFYNLSFRNNERKQGFVHNQILWNGTGLARWYSINKKNKESNNVKDNLEYLLETWMNINHDDGGAHYCSPSNQEPLDSLDGNTTYYHSRQLAFAIYIANLINYKNEKFDQIIKNGASFLLRMMRPNGQKDLILDTKRYYHHSISESASNPFDIFVFSHLFEKSKDNIWMDLASVSLNNLLRCQQKNGAIHASPELINTSWQCNVVRNSHIAWLTRVNSEFILNAMNLNVKYLKGIDKFFEVDNNKTFFNIGNCNNWIKFISKKSRLSICAGQRTIGLVPKTINNINNLNERILFSYETSGDLIYFLRNNVNDISLSFKWFFYHAKHLIIHKKFSAAKNFFVSFLSYLNTFNKLRSEFPLVINNLNIKNESIIHQIQISDIKGRQVFSIGNREINIIEDKVKITDLIYKSGIYNIYVPYLIKNKVYFKKKFFKLEKNQTKKFNFTFDIDQFN